MTNNIATWKGSIALEYRYTAGVAGERYAAGLREGRILAAWCKPCGVKYLPPRIYCERCLLPLEDWSEVKGSAYLYSYTVVHPGRRPLVIGLAKFEGIEGGLLAPVSTGGKKLKAGSGVKVSIRRGKIGLVLKATPSAGK